MIGYGGSGNTLDVYLGGNSLPEVARRIHNLLAGREFAIFTCVGGVSIDSTPRSVNSVSLADQAPFAVSTRPAPNRSDFATEYRVNAVFDPAPDALDLITHYDTAAEAAAAAHSGEHVADRLTVTRVVVRGGSVAGDCTAQSGVDILTTSGWGGTAVTTLKPRWVPFAGRIAAEADFFDALARVLDADGPDAAMNANAARAAAARVRLSTKSEFTGQVMAA